MTVDIYQPECIITRHHYWLFILHSDRYSTDEVTLRWDPADVQYSNFMEMPRYALTNVITGDCTTEYITGELISRIEQETHYSLHQVEQ